MTPKDEKFERIAQRHIADLKKSSKAIVEDAAVRAVHKMAQARGLIDIGRVFTPEKEQSEPPPEFIDALKYDTALRDSEAQQAYEDAFVNGTGVMLGDKRIDQASIYKQPAQQREPVACQPRGLIDIGRVFTPEKAEEPKPVAWKKKGAFHFCNQPPVDVEKWIPLYKSHTQRWQTWASLTDEEIETIHRSVWIQSTATLNDFARAVEAKLKEKNT